MSRFRLGWARGLVLAMAGCAISAGAVVELSSHAARSTASAVRQATAVPQSELGLVAPPAAFTSGRPPPASGRRDATRWAPVLHATVARRAPSDGAARAGSVPMRTGDGTTNIVVADGEATRSGALWERVRLTELPNGTQGWVPRRDLGGWAFVHSRLVVDRSRLTASLYRGRRVIFQTRIAIGAAGTPTPAGRFYIRDRLSGFKTPMYGPLAFGTNARSPTLTDWPDGGIVGIHGTDRPDLIPGRVSHGCVRMTNPAILRLGKLMPVGTPVIVR
jgi:hypothetical protein